MSGDMATLVRPETCKTCPFRGGFALDRERRQGVATGVDRGQTFHCHSEVDYDVYDDDVYEDDYDEDDYDYDASKARMCAGAATIVERDPSRSHPLMRLDERLGHPFTPDPKVPFQDWNEWIEEPEFSDPRDGRPVSMEGCAFVGPGCEAPAGWMGNGVTTNYGPYGEIRYTECTGEPICTVCKCDCADCEAE